MNFEEQTGKGVLRARGLPVPDGRVCASPDAAAAAAGEIGPCVVKAQVPTGRRGKAGGIGLAADPTEAKAHAAAILGMEIDGHTVGSVLVEQRVSFDGECFVSIAHDPASKGPLMLFSTRGGVDIEAVAAETPEQLRRAIIDIRAGFHKDDALRLLDRLDVADCENAIADFLIELYAAYRACDAELLEVNPLACLPDGGVMALDCKLVVDDQAADRQSALIGQGSPDMLTPLEARARERGLKYIELPGRVGILANGAGLTMASMDAVAHYGGAPANFLEIGGEAYTKGRDALEIVLANPSVKSLLVNFCGAFARTDVMTEGLIEAWEALKPTVPVFFTIHGTGEAEAIRLVRDRLGVEPYDAMDDAVIAAIEAAR